MIRILRHIGIHLWITVLFGIPVSFLTSLLLLQIFSAASALVVSAAVVAMTLAGSSILMNVAGQRSVVRLIKEGQAWERSGIKPKAEKCYVRAMRIYDSFLLWPGTARKTALRISKAVAAFHLNNKISSFSSGTCVYLKMNPEDKALAKLWLKQLRHKNGIESFEQDLLTLLAQKYASDARILEIIAEIFVNFQRNDLVAKQVYQQMLLTSESGQAAGQNSALRAQVLDLIEDTALGQDPVQDSAMSTAVREKFQPVEHAGLFGKKILTMAGKLIKTIRAVLAGMVETAVSAASKSASALRHCVQLFRTHKQLRRVLRNAVLVFASTGLILFLVTTVFHTLKTRVQQRRQIVHEAAIPKPFTIQVAAYLKQEHARRYVEQLKKSQVNAVVKMVEGGGKTWFVVHVSQFADKQSAAQYGRELKAKKLIDDFFVNNR